MSFYTVLFSGAAALGGLLFAATFWLQRLETAVPRIVSKLCLVSASLIFGIGFSEGFLILLQKNAAHRGTYPPPPDVFIHRDPHPNWLIDGSILYNHPPNGSFRTFGYKFSTNALGFREKNFDFKKPENTFWP